MARGGNYIQFSGTIDKIARNQGSFLIIDNGDELWFSVGYNPGGLGGAQIGDEVEFEYEEKKSGGKVFNNVKSEVTIVGEGSAERQAPPARQQRAAPARREAPQRSAPAQRQAAPARAAGGDDPRQKSIVRQNSLTQANALFNNLVRLHGGSEAGENLLSLEPLEAAELVVEVARVFEAYSMAQD